MPAVEEMTFEIVPKDSGLAPETRHSLEVAFSDYFKQGADLKHQAENITDPQLARVVRLKIRKVRTDADKRRKELKEDSLRMGRAIDGANNILIALLAPIEERMDAIEKKAEREQQEREQALDAERRAKMAPFNMPHLTAGVNLGAMKPADFDLLYTDAEQLHKARIERERKEQEAAAARELEAAQERERLRVENERLQREAEEAEERAQKERQRVAAEKKALEEKHAQEKAEAEKKAQAERDAAAAKLKKEKEAADAKLKKEREAAEAKLAEERRQREELEAQQRRATEAENTRRQEEDRRNREEAEAAERAAAAPDKEKIIAFCKALFSVPLPAVTSKRAKNLLRECGGEIQDQINTLEVEASKL